MGPASFKSSTSGPERTSLTDTLQNLRSGAVKGDKTQQLVQLGHGKLQGNNDGRCHVTVKRLCSLDSVHQLNISESQLEELVAAGEIAILDTTNKALRVANETKEQWSRAGETEVDEVILEADEEDHELDLKDIGIASDLDFTVYLPRHSVRRGRNHNLRKQHKIDTEDSSDSDRTILQAKIKRHISPLVKAIKTRLAENRKRSVLGQRKRTRKTIRLAKTRQATYRRRQRRRLDRDLRRKSDEQRSDAKQFKRWHDVVWGRVVSQLFDQRHSSSNPKHR